MLPVVGLVSNCFLPKIPCSFPFLSFYFLVMLLTSLFL